MPDPNPADPGPTAEPTPASAPEPLPLAERYPACFDWSRPRPLKLGIHRDLVAAGHDWRRVRRALAAYCGRPRYLKALQAGAARIDLAGQPAGVVTEADVALARASHAACVAALPPNATPVPEEYLVPGRLELTVKFSELPRPLAVRDGLKIGLQTGEGMVTAILPAKVWRRLEQAARDYPQWVAALSGSLERFADGEIALKHPTLQVFEKKVRSEAAAEGRGPEPNGPAVEAPDANTSAGKKPEEKAAAVKAPDRPTPAAPPQAPPYPKLSLKGRGATQGAERLGALAGSDGAGEGGGGRPRRFTA